MYQKKKKNSGEDEEGVKMDLKLSELTGYVLPAGNNGCT